MTSENAELIIDDEAMRRADLAHGEAIGKQAPAVDAAVAAAAPRIVAVELRAQADFLDRAINRRGNTRNVQNINKAYAFMARVLRARADELDPGSPATTEETG